MWGGIDMRHGTSALSSSREHALLEVKQWQHEVKQVLENSTFNENLCRELLQNDGADHDNDTSVESAWNTMQHGTPMVFKGLPARPFCKVLANRLFLSCHFMSEWKDTQEMPSPLLLPADKFGLQEFERNFTYFPKDPNAIKDWIHDFREDGIMYMLGLRKTIGGCDLQQKHQLPPPRKELLQASSAPCNQELNSQLSVAARARAKHAHRTLDDSNNFFGYVKGGEQEQNVAAQNVISMLLDQAVWINIHTFGGMEGVPVLELRIASGYGARWKVLETAVEFRGFLEPQMLNGHEVGWRHS